MTSREEMLRLRTITEALMPLISEPPTLAVILGSGLGALADLIETPVSIKFENIPGFHASTVAGHHGRLIFGRLQQVQVAVMQGRIHAYEGHDMPTVVRLLRALHLLGAKDLLVTNAAGGINPRFGAGDFMIINDHLNLMGVNPLRGPNLDELGPRFPDMSQAYDAELISLAAEAAAHTNVQIHQGIYAACSGPSYETPAEVRMLALLGADAVGMSTVPEVIAARHMGMRVTGISCISNAAAGLSGQPLSHVEVEQTANRVSQDFIALILHFIELYRTH